MLTLRYCQAQSTYNDMLFFMNLDYNMYNDFHVYKQKMPFCVIISLVYFPTFSFCLFLLSSPILFKPEMISATKIKEGPPPLYALGISWK